VPIGGSGEAGEARQTIAEMAAQLLELEVVQRAGAGKQRGIIGDAELDMLLDRRREVVEGRRVGWKSSRRRRGKGASSPSDGARSASEEESPWRGDARDGLFEVYEAPVYEGNDALAHMLGEDVAA